MLNIYLKNYLSIALVFILLIPQLIFAESIVSNSTVTISATVVAIPGGETGGGGGGKVEEKSIDNIDTSINFSGIAYPRSRVYVLQDGVIKAITISDADSRFFISIPGIASDTYTFSIYSLDSKDRKSSSYSFPIFITAGTTVNIGNIFLSATIDTDKSEVRKGDNILIFGQSTPKSEITISIHSDPEYFYKVNTNDKGEYSYNFNTSILLLGKHQTKSKATKGVESSLYNSPVSFIVGDGSKLKDGKVCSTIRGDLNCDTRVNLIDFSIMAYWYKKLNPPKIVDLNSDGKISLVDFSIMAFNWTG